MIFRHSVKEIHSVDFQCEDDLYEILWQLYQTLAVQVKYDSRQNYIYYIIKRKAIFNFIHTWRRLTVPSCSPL